MEEKRIFRKDDCVLWTYKHYLNSKAYTLITKKGKFIRRIKSKRVDGGASWDEYEYCLVHFRGNKNPSRVKIEEIKKC